MEQIKDFLFGTRYQYFLIHFHYLGEDNEPREGNYVSRWFRAKNNFRLCNILAIKKEIMEEFGLGGFESDIIIKNIMFLNKTTEYQFTKRYNTGG